MSTATETLDAADEKMVTISLSELEALVRRVAHSIILDEIRDELRVESRDAVRAAVCEEMKRAFGLPLRKLLEEWEHQGPYDPEGDDLLLADALEIIEKYKDDRSGFITLEELEAELAAEAAAESKAKADELPRGNLAGGA